MDHKRLKELDEEREMIVKKARKESELKTKKSLVVIACLCNGANNKRFRAECNVACATTEMFKLDSDDFNALIWDTMYKLLATNNNSIYECVREEFMEKSKDLI